MTRASDLARLLGAGATINDGTTITTDDNTVQLSLTSTDADANSGPELELYRNSASPADNDFAGTISFQAENDAGEKIEYGVLKTRIVDASDGTEDFRMTFEGKVGGSDVQLLKMDNSNIVFNEDSQDIDFRVESNGETHALFVQAGSDCVGIKTTSPNDYYADDFVVTAPDEGGMTIVQGTGHRGYLAFADGTSGSQAYRGYISYDHNDDTLYLGTEGGGKLLIDTTGAVTKPSQPAFLVGMSSNSAAFGNGLFTPTLDTEIFDQNADFSSNTFTAPVTGRYYLSWLVYAGNLDTGASYYYLKLFTSNREYTKYLFTSSFDSDAAYYGWHTSVLADMDANDTATFHIGQVNGHSNSVVYASNTYASGALIC